MVCARLALDLELRSDGPSRVSNSLLFTVLLRPDRANREESLRDRRDIANPIPSQSRFSTVPRELGAHAPPSRGPQDEGTHLPLLLRLVVFLLIQLPPRNAG